MEQNREELLGNVSHDLKNPLTTVKAYLAMLGQGRMGDVPEKQLHAHSRRRAQRGPAAAHGERRAAPLPAPDREDAAHQRPFGLRALVSDVMAALASSGELSPGPPHPRPRPGGLREG